MSKLDKDVLIKGLLTALEKQERCVTIRKTILDDESKVSDSEYEVACQVLDEASIAYFKLGFEACRTLILESAA
jgi:hypothetical protein